MNNNVLFMSYDGVTGEPLFVTYNTYLNIIFKPNTCA